MLKRLHQSRLAWALLSNGLRVGGYALVLPIALKTIPEAEMAIWWLFVAIQALVVQADFGLGPSISRGLAYLLAGASSLQAGSAKQSTTVDVDKVKGFIHSSHWVYRWVVLVAVLILGAASFFIVPMMGAGTFSRGSFGKPPAPAAAAFVDEVRSGDTPPALWLRGKLPPTVLAPFTPEQLTNRSAGEERLVALAKAMNALSESGLLYDPERFAGVALRDETRQLVADATTGASVTRANRLLLEDAFPRTLVHDSTVLRGPEWRRMAGSWFVFAFGVVLTLSTTRFINFLTGADHVRLAQQLSMVGMAANLGLTAAGLLTGLGFAAMALGSLANGVCQSILGRWAVRQYLGAYLGRGNEAAGRAVFRELWPTAWRAGLVSLGAYLIYNSNVFWAAKLGQPEASQYPFTLRLMQLLMTVCGLPVTTQMPKIARWMAEGETSQAWRFFLRLHLLGLGGMAVGVVVLSGFGPTLLNLYGSDNTLLPGPALLFMGFIYLLEFNHAYFATLILSRNEVPFVWAATISGAAICVGGWLFSGPFGVWGLLGTVFIVQFSWNNWWSPVYALRTIRDR